MIIAGAGITPRPHREISPRGSGAGTVSDVAPPSPKNTGDRGRRGAGRRGDDPGGPGAGGHIPPVSGASEFLQDFPVFGPYPGRQIFPKIPVSGATEFPKNREET